MKPKAGTRAVNAEQLGSMIEFLVESIVVVYGDVAYKQFVGIPMGTDCAPFLAHLYLFALEYKWVTKQALTVEGREKLSKLSIVSRYIDDLVTVNGEEVRESSKAEIYKGLVLKKESTVSYKTHFLDLNMTIHKKEIRLSAYDKRDAFSFAVRSFPDLSGNVHVYTSHGIIVGQLRRFAAACDHLVDFKKRLSTLTSRLLNQGFDKGILEKKISKYYEQRKGLLYKYRCSQEGFVSGCFKRRG